MAATVAASGNNGSGGDGGARPGVKPGRKKQSEWVGVRPRQTGRWAAEIRVPRTREKLWIGTFESDRMAALAYDAAVFCFYGENLPKARRINFDALPRPEVTDAMRARLTVANVKAIAEHHARTVDARLRAAAPPLPPPPPPPAAAAGPFAGAAGPSAPATATYYHGVPAAMADNNNLLASAVDDSQQISFDADVIAALMGLVPGEY
ncbi:unnamed protein product [Urochloa decumbens]|uniref:AP2/ERF domain-containing protein n=1 Tax=Urochloa decumbens TaxID=240449 RepID=A0ABC9C3L3_9POAL